MYSIPLCTLRGDSSVHVVTRSAAKTADLADPTTDTREAFAHPITDHNRNTSVSLGQSRHRVIVVVPVPSLYTLSSMSTQSLLFLECPRSPPTRSVAKLPLFLSFWTAHRDLSCALVPVPSLYVTPHSSTTCATMLCNPFHYYQVLIPTFPIRESIPPPISPLYHNTSHDSSPECPGAPTLSSNQEFSLPPKCLRSSLKPKWEKPNRPYLVRNDSSDGALPIPLTFTLSNNLQFFQFPAHEFHRTIHSTI